MGQKPWCAASLYFKLIFNPFSNRYLAEVKSKESPGIIRGALDVALKDPAK
jgi:hypothetical protein